VIPKETSMRVLAALLLAGALVQGAAAAFPTRPVRLIVPVTPGGGADFTARHLAQKLGDAWGQTVIVDNRPGATGNVGVELAARATPDGHTIVLPITSLSVNPSLYAKMPFDTQKDLAPIVLVATGALLLVVHPAMPARTVADLIAAAKAKPKGYNYASAGSGTTAHLASELFNRMAGVQIVSVPYRGAAAATVDLISGQVHMFFSTVPSVVQHYKAGRVRALAVSSPRRVPDLPDVPTVAESGLPGFEVVYWFGLFAPAGTPRDAIGAINTATNRVLELAETREKFGLQGMTPGGGKPEELGAFLRSEIARWGKVVRDAGIRAE